jgi:hypothetical protein
MVYLVSAAPAEIVDPVARHLGAHGAVASVARIGGDGRYTGDLERYAYGQEKAAQIRHLARREGLDLSASFAYTDSATDLPMLEAVGHPVAVNPDRALRRIAQLRGWEVLRFERLLEPALVLEARASGRGARILRGSAAAAVVAAAGGAGAVAWRYRAQWGRAQPLRDRALRDRALRDRALGDRAPGNRAPGDRARTERGPVSPRSRLTGRGAWAPQTPLGLNHT